MKKLLILLLFIITGCTYPLEKPFIIINKWHYNESINNYEYQDKKGHIRTFTDSIGKYNVGDTL